MARTPFADKPLGSQEGEDVVHGQDEQVEEEGCGEEEEIILDDGAAGFALPHPRLSHPPTLSRAVLAAPPRVLSGEVDASSFEGMVAMLEDIMMDEGFNDLVGGFMKKHCGEFDEGEENKLV